MRSLTFLSFSILLLISICAVSSQAYGGSSDLTIESIWLEKASAPGVPIAGIDLPVNASFNIVASVKNVGQETALGFYLDVYYDGDFGRGGPDNISPGEVQEWYVGPLTALAGTHTTQWVVDPDNKIAELNEGNNQKMLTFTIGQPVSTVTTVTATKTVTGTTTSTVTSYTGTRTMTSTIVVTAAGTAGPSTATAVGQTTQVLASTGTTTVTGYMTLTVTSYTATRTMMSTVVVPATGTTGPLTSTGIGETAQVLTSTGTMTVTGHTTTTVTSYTGTSTSTSTVVVYTSVAKAAASVGAPNLLVYVGFLSLFVVAVGQRVIAGGKGWKIPRVVSCRRPLSTSSPLSSVPTLVERGAH